MKRDIYRGLALANDIEAAMRGPVPFVKRLIRKVIYAKAFGLLRRLMHALGLM
jgi:hypothetical protein